MSGEDGCDRELPMSAQHQAETGQPLVELGDDVRRLLTLSCILWRHSVVGNSTQTFEFVTKNIDNETISFHTDLSKKPSCQETKEHGIVGLTVEPRHADVAQLPQLDLPAVQRPGRERNVYQNNVGTAFNEPAPKVDLWGK